MKNKEIEELLSDIKKQITIDEKIGKEIAKDFHKTTLNYKEIKLLLSYIEQLENENENLKQKHYLIEGGRGNLKSYTLKLEKENKQLQNKCESLLEDRKQLLNVVNILENNRDKAIEYLKEKADYPISYYHCIRETIDILKGDSDD